MYFVHIWKLTVIPHLIRRRIARIMIEQTFHNDYMDPEQILITHNWWRKGSKRKIFKLPG